LDVVDEPGGDGGGSLRGVKGQREALEVLEEVAPEIGDDAVAEVDGAMATGISDNGEQQRRARADADQHQEPLLAVLEAFRGVRRGRGDHPVDRRTYQPWEDECERQVDDAG